MKKGGPPEALLEIPRNKQKYINNIRGVVGSRELFVIWMAVASFLSNFSNFSSSPFQLLPSSFLRLHPILFGIINRGVFLRVTGLPSPPSPLPPASRLWSLPLRKDLLHLSTLFMQLLTITPYHLPYDILFTYRLMSMHPT